MKRKKRFRNECFMIIALALLLFGCASDDMVTDDQVTDGANIENEEIITLSVDNAANALEVSENSVIGEENESQESAEEETINIEYEYRIDEDFVINYNEAFTENEVFAELSVPDHIVGEEDIVGEFCEGFPEELQQILLYCNDSKSEGDDAWEAYRLQDYEVITDDGTSDISFDDIESDVGVSYYALRVIDIDSDGEDEYIGIQDVGTAHLTWVDVIKYYNGRWHMIANGTAYTIGAPVDILEYEGDTYIFVEDTLACWNKEYDSEDPDDTEWNAMAVDREVAGYTPNELYGREGDSIDYLAGVDLENIENNTERSMFGPIWDYGEWYVTTRYEWEEEYGGKTYLYVVSDFFYLDGHGFPQDDYLLTVFEEGDGCMEAVKVYYLKGDYRLTFEDNQYGPDGRWKPGGRG